MLERWMSLLVDYAHSQCGQMMREPAGLLTHPYTVPTAGPSAGRGVGQPGRR